jgi:hypothetical protein
MTQPRPAEVLQRAIARQKAAATAATEHAATVAQTERQRAEREALDRAVAQGGA